MHIIRNAIDAVKGHTDAPAEPDTVPNQPEIKISTSAIDKNRIILWIADNGPGIAPAIQEQIFDPFFTTKEVGKGTGLGLSISYQIVTAQHRGELKCYSVPGQGTKFSIELPVALPQPSARTLGQSAMLDAEPVMSA